MRQHLDRDEVGLLIDSDAHTLYNLVSDVTRTPEFSPSIRACEWLDGATGPAVGARFKAVNVAGSGRAWSNKPVVTEAEPGSTFAFRRTEPFAGTVEWRYRFVPQPAGTLVIESYEVIAPVTLIGWFIIGVVFGEKDQATKLHQGMQETLHRLAAAAGQCTPGPNTPSRGS